MPLHVHLVQTPVVCYRGVVSSRDRWMLHIKVLLERRQIGEVFLPEVDVFDLETRT